MQIRLLTRDDIDERLWNQMVSRSENSLIYAFSWYLDEVATDWYALVLGAYEAGWPIPFKKKWGITYAFQPPLCQQLGIFFTRPLLEHEINEFYAALPKSTSFFDINVNYAHPHVVSLPPLIPLANFELYIGSDFVSLKTNFSSNIIRNAKRAEKLGLQIFNALDPWDIIAFYESIYSQNEGAFTPEISATAKRLARTCKQYGYLISMGVYGPENTLCAGALFLVAGKRIIYLMGGADAAGKQNGAMHFLFYSLIAEYSANDYLLDFEGSRIPGIADFFKQFGANLNPYYRWRYSRWSAVQKWLDKKPV